MANHLHRTLFVTFRVLLALSCAQVLSACSIKAEIWDELKSIVSNPTPGPGNHNQGPWDIFPKDLSTPLFQDDFNRPDEALSANLKWKDGISPSLLTHFRVSSSDNSGNAYLTPNDPTAFPDLSKVYLEASVIISGTTRQVFAILPYTDLGGGGIYGCAQSYDPSTKTLNIYNGDFMPVIMGTAVPIASLVNYPVDAVNYFGCEVDQATGTSTVFLNSVQIGMETGLSIPSASGSMALIYYSGNGGIIDDVKAFPSFLDGREPNNDSGLRIYNPPYQKYFLNQLASYNLQGYCATNGSTVQVKDSNGVYQSAIATCVNHSFDLTLDLTDSVRFPVGQNQIRIEYVSGGTTSEYFWSFENIGALPVPQILSPSPLVGNSTTQFTWVVSYPNAASISLSAADVSLSGTATQDCQISIEAVDATKKKVVVDGCSADGDLMISIAAGTGQSGSGAAFLAAGPSTSVTVANTLPSLSIAAPTPVIGNSTKEFSFRVTYSLADTINLTAAKVVLVDDNDVTLTGVCSVSISSVSSTEKDIKLSSCVGDVPVVKVKILAGTATNAAGTLSSDTTSNDSILVDNTAPVVTVTRTGATEGDSSTTFSWDVVVTYDPVSPAIDTSKLEIFGTGIDGCQLSWNIIGATTNVYVTGCTSVVGSVNIRALADFAIDVAGNKSSLAQGSAVSVYNKVNVSAAFVQEKIDKSLAPSSSQLRFTLDRIAPEDIQVGYDTSLLFTTAQVGVDHNLPLKGVATIPAGQSSASITYQHIQGTGDNKFLQVFITKLDGGNVRAVLKDQVARVVFYDGSANKGFKVLSAEEHGICGVDQNNRLLCWDQSGSSAVEIDTGVAYKSVRARRADGSTYSRYVTMDALSVGGQVMSYQFPVAYGAPQKERIASGPGGNRFSKIAVYNDIGGDELCGLTSGSLNGTPDGKILCTSWNEVVTEPLPGYTFIDIESLYSSNRWSSAICGLTSSFDVVCASGDTNPPVVVIAGAPAFHELLSDGSICGRTADQKVYCGIFPSSGGGYPGNYVAEYDGIIQLGNRCYIDSSNNMKCDLGTGSGYVIYDSGHKYSTLSFILSYNGLRCGVEQSTGLVRCTYPSGNYGGYSNVLSDVTGYLFVNPIQVSSAPFASVGSSNGRTCAIRKDTSEVYCWGNSSSYYDAGFAGFKTGQFKVASGSFTQTTGFYSVRNDGKAILTRSWGLNSTPVQSLLTGLNVVKVSGDCALTSDGDVYVISTFDYNSTLDVYPVRSNKKFKDIGCSTPTFNGRHGYALTVDGEFAIQTNYQYDGNGGVYYDVNIVSSADVYTSVSPGGYVITDAFKAKRYDSGTTFISIDAGSDYKKIEACDSGGLCGITTAGDLRCNRGGIVFESSFTSIDPGIQYRDLSGSCGVTTDDKLKCWGTDWLGKLGLGRSSNTTPIYVGP